MILIFFYLLALILIHFHMGNHRPMEVMVQVVTQEKLRHKEVRHLRKEHFIQQLEYLRQRGAWFGSVREIGGAWKVQG